MAFPLRFTFISDPTDEFPNNTNNKFKVRLPTPLRLEERGQWYASLWSLSVPDKELPNSTLFADTTSNVFEFHYTMYKLSGYSSGKYQTLTLVPKTETLTIADVMNDSTPAQTGVQFWKNCVRMMNETIIEALLETKQSNSALPVAIPNAWKPMFKWEGDDLILEASDSVMTEAVVSAPYSWFAMSEKLALSFGFLRYSSLFRSNILGDNASAYYPVYEEKGTKIATAVLNANQGLKGPTRAALLTPDVDTTDPKISFYKIDNGMIYFSRAVQWNFLRLNDSFANLHNGKEVVMVYTDLVQSTVVGNGRFPLLRKLSVVRKGEGRVTVEPYHREWVPVQSNVIEMVEIQLSTPGGALTHLSPGKTLVTLGLQQRL